MLCIHNLYNVTNLERIWGEDVSYENYNLEQLRLMKILDWFDFTILENPKLFFKSFLKKKINIRQNLAKLNLIKHLAQTMNEINVTKDGEFDGFINEVVLLRQTWFTNKEGVNLSRIISCMKEGLKIFFNLISRFNNYLDLKEEYKIFKMNFSNGDVIGFKNKEDTTYFEKNWDAATSLSKTIDNFSKTQKYFQFLPINFSFQLLQYKDFGGRFGNFIENQLFLKPKLLFGEDYLPAKKRAKYINEHIEFLENKKIIGGEFFNYLGYVFAGRKMRGEYRYGNYQRWIGEKFHKFKLFKQGGI